MGRSRYKFQDPYPHFLTCTIVNWIPIFSRPERVQIILDSLRFLQQQNRLSLHGYVILENHLHLIASANGLSREMRTFKSYTARSIIDWCIAHRSNHLLEQLSFYKLAHRVDQDYQLWQEGSHPQVISSPSLFRQKLEYAHYNPVRRGYVDDPAHWRYSSFRNYHGLEGLLPVDLIEL